MPTIKIDVHNKLARCADKRAFAVCGNNDYTISFNFDSEWDDYPAKTARFAYNGKYQDVVFTGTECAMPALYGVNSVFIGVYAGDIRTTAPAQLLMVRSIMDGKPKHDEPTADVYNQILALMEAGKIKGDKGDKGDQGEQGIQGIQGIQGEPGKDGKDGANGKDGADGFSPTATVTQTSTGADISVTDKNGTTNAHIENGSDANVTNASIMSGLGFAPDAVGRCKVIDGEFYGLCTQSDTSDVSGLINTPSTSDVQGTRIIMAADIEPYDIITATAGETWTAENVSMEYHIVVPETNKYIVKGTGYTTFSTSTPYVITYTGSVKARVFLGARYTYKAPDTWGAVPSGDYSRAISLKVTRRVNEQYLHPACLVDIHRGYSSARNNSLQAIVDAASLGYRCVELDLRMTSDGVLVMNHDATISGDVGSTYTTYTIANTAYADLKKLTLANPGIQGTYSGGYERDTIALFEDTLKLCKRLNMVIVLDLKLASSIDSSRASQIINLCKYYDMTDNIIYNVNDIESCARVMRACDPNVKILFTAIADSHDEFLTSGEVYISLSSSLNAAASQEQIDAIKAKGYKYVVWNVTKATIKTDLQYDPCIIEPSESEKGLYNWYELIEEVAKERFDGVSWPAQKTDKEAVVDALGYTPLETAPVTSVNGKTGAVELAASDVGAISSADGSVQNAHLASGAVTTDKLAEAERMTSANIVGALGYEPEKKSGGWKLIETITLTEDTAEIVRTAEPDGTAYNFKAMCINFKTPFSGIRYAMVYFSDDPKATQKYSTYTRISQNSTVAGRYGFTRVDCTKEFNEWHIYQREFMSAWSVPNVGYYTTVQEGTLSYCEHWTGGNLRYMRILQHSGTEAIPSGTTINIYAVRS